MHKESDKLHHDLRYSSQNFGQSNPDQQINSSTRYTNGPPSSLRHPYTNPMSGHTNNVASGHRSMITNQRSLLYPQLNAPNYDLNETERQSERLYYTPMQEIPSGHDDNSRYQMRGDQINNQSNTFSPHLQQHSFMQKRRGFAEINESQFQTPLSMAGYRNVENESTVKPNFQDTVSRTALNYSQIVPKSRSLRLANNMGGILSNSRNFAGGALKSANFQNKTQMGGFGIGPGLHRTRQQSPLQRELFKQPRFGARNEGVFPAQARSPQFGGGDNQTNKSMNQSAHLFNIQQSGPDQNPIAAESFQMNASNQVGETHLEYIKNMSFENKQKAINSCKTLVESIAMQQAHPDINDLSRQLEKSNPDGSIVPAQFHQYEFEPVQFQPSAQSLVPKIVRQTLKQIDCELRDPQFTKKLTAVQFLNLKESFGSYVEDHYFLAHGTALTLWKPATRTLYGVNTFKEGAQIANASASERKRTVDLMNSQYSQVHFRHPIQRVQYVEQYNESQRPYMIIVTEEDIQLMRFKKKDPTAARLELNGQKTSKAQIQKYDLLQLEPSDYQPSTIDLKEEVSQIIQLRKNGRIFYASHTNDYKKTYLKELLFAEMAGSIQQVSNFGQHLGFDQKNVQSIATKLIGQNKRIRTQIALNSTMDCVKRGIHNMVPTFIDYYSERKCITEIKVDESRNIMYVLTSQLVKHEAPPDWQADAQKEEAPDDMSNVPLEEDAQDIDLMERQAIEVYDLGMFGDQMSKIVTISQDKLFDNLQRKLGLTINKRSQEYDNELRLHRITSMHPITSSESQKRHLLLTTLNGLRVFLTFKTAPQTEQGMQSQSLHVEQRKAQFETFREECFSEQWAICSVHSMPLESEAMDIHRRESAEGFYVSPFQIQLMHKQKHHLQQDHGQDGSTHPVVPAFCNNSSTLIYQDGNSLTLSGDLGQNYLSLNFLTKNEGTYCFSRLKQEDSDCQCINETFSMLLFQKLKGGLDDEQDEDMGEMSQQIGNIEDENERVLHIRDPNQDSFNLGYLNREVGFNLQRMLGANPALRSEPMWGLSNFLNYMPLSILERQVYDAAQFQPIKVLTNKRHINIVQLRPIDQLAQILISTAGQSGQNYSLKDFDSFAQKFTLREVCCMLVQIISEHLQGTYYHSRKVNQAISLANQSQIQQELARTNNLFDRSGAQLSHGQPRQVRAPNSTAFKRNLTMSQRSAAFGSTNQRFNFDRSGIGMVSPSQSGLRRQHDASEGMISKSLPFVFNQSEDLGLPAHTIDQQRINENAIEVTDEDIIKEMYSPQNEINSNCYLQQLGMHQQAIQLARQLLMVYGDSINGDNVETILGHYQMQNQPIQSMLDPSLLTLRHQAIFTYAQRILRPIWDMNLTSRQKRSDGLDKQKMNVEMFAPALDKLLNLLSTLESCEKDLTYQTSPEDQAKLLGKDPSQMQQSGNFEGIGIQSNEILNQVVFTFNLENQIKERIEASQVKVLKNAIIFVRRCIDAIQFLKVVSFQQTQDEKLRKELFASMLKQIQKQKNGAAFLKELANTKYKDLVLQGGSHETLLTEYQDESCEQIILDAQGSSEAQGTEKSKLIHKLYDNAIHIAVARENKHNPVHIGVGNIGLSVQTAIQQRAIEIQQLCPTMFTQSQTTTFIGQSILHQAVDEPDAAKKETLIKQSIVQLMKLPQNINLHAVVPDLCKTNRYMTIIDLCMRKIKKLEEIIEQSKVQRMHSSLNTSQQRHMLNQSMHSVSSMRDESNKEQSLIVMDDYRDQYHLLIECYDVICNLFLALDNSLQNLKDPNNLVENVKMLVELKKHQGKDVAYLFDEHLKSFNETKWYTIFINHFVDEARALTAKNPGINVETSKLVQMDRSKGIHTKQGKIRLRREIVHGVEAFGDIKLIRTLFLYMIGLSKEQIQLEDLPRIDYDNFIDICRHIFAQSEIMKVSIDTLIKLMCDKDRFVSPQASDIQKMETGNQIKQRLCQFVLRLCQDNSIKVVKPAASTTGSAAGAQKTEVIHLTCQDKITYCKVTIDQMEDSPDMQKYLMDHGAPVNFAENVRKLQDCVSTLSYQVKVIEAAQEKIKILEGFEAKANDKLRVKLKARIEKLKQQKKALDTVNCKYEQLYTDFVEGYSLYPLMYEELRNRQTALDQQINYADLPVNEQQHIDQQFLEIFSSNLQEIINCTQDSVQVKFLKPNDDQFLGRRWLNADVVKEMFRCFRQLRVNTRSRAIALEALKKIVNLKINNFIANYGHDSQKAFELLISLVKEIIDKGQVKTNEEFALTGLYIDVVCQQKESTECRYDDIRTILQEMYDHGVAADNGRQRNSQASLTSNLIVCHMLVHSYEALNVFIKYQKQRDRSLGLKSLQDDMHQQLTGHYMEQNIASIETIFADCDLVLPKQFGNTMQKFIAVIKKDMAEATRRIEAANGMAPKNQQQQKR